VERTNTEPMNDNGVGVVVAVATILLLLVPMTKG
jgi:hypothetical protein